MDIKEAHKALDKAKIWLMYSNDSVFFTHICFSLQHVFDETVPTACTDGLTVRYNPTFFMDLDSDEQVFLLLHESLHVALQHMIRRGDLDPRLYNIAADYVINYMLVSRGFKMPEGGLYDEKYDESWSTAQVYEDIKNNPPEDLPWEDIPEGTGEDAQPSDELQEKIDDILIQAAIQEEIAKGEGAGDIPGELGFYIDSLRAPVLPWNRLVQQFMSKVVRRGYTWKRPNRRFFPKHYLPSRNSEALCDLAVAIDTSCSVSDADFHRFASEIYNLLKTLRPTSLTLVQFDTKIHDVSTIHSPRDLMNTKFIGRGGTRIGPVIEWAAENKPTALLVFTDGHYALNTPNPKVPVIWLINDNPHYQAPWGRIVHYEA